MLAQFVFEYPTWYLVVCLAVGLAYALALYAKERQFLQEYAHLHRIMGFLRFLTVTIICLLLLTPVLRSSFTESKMPIVVLAQDNSQSISEAMRESQRDSFVAQMRALEESLGQKFELQSYSFGEQVQEGTKYSFEDRSTDISKAFSELYDLYSGQNLSAVVLASDGIYNQGNNPLYSATRLNVPIYSVALGDTLPKKDLVLKRVYNNQIAYLGDKFTVQVDVSAIYCGSATTNLRIEQGGRVLHEEALNIENNDYFTTKEIVLPANRAGMQRYDVSLSAVQGEVTRVNNKKEFYIDVLDARQKILLLGDAPHPDLAALRRLLSKNKNYEVELAYADKLKKQIAEYDFVVLHQLPSKRLAARELLQVIKSKKIPHLFILGTASDLPALAQAQGLAAPSNYGNGQMKPNDVEGLLNSNFSLFTLDEKLAEKLRRFPPISAPFADYTVQPDAQVLIRQKIGSVETSKPLLILGEEAGVKKGLLFAEGIYKWRLADYAQHENHFYFDELLGKTIQYLCTKEDKRKFRAFASNTLYGENEQISIDAELYNSNYERVNEPEATLELINEKGESFPFTFNKTANAYTLKTGPFPAGRYQFKAKTNYNGEQLGASGEFAVQALQLEIFETTADHRILSLLSSRTGGQLVYPNAIASIPALIDAQGYAKPILYERIESRGLIHYKWIFFLLLALLGLEWFLRRYFGSY